MVTWDQVREAYKRGIENGLDDVATAFVNEAKAIIRDEAFDEGTLHRSDEVRRPDRFVREVAFTADHAQKVHDGQEPGTMPDFDAIKGWVQRNLRISVPSGGWVFKPRTREGTRSPRQDEIHQVTQAVRFKIFAEGIEPVSYATRARKNVEPRLGRLMQDAINAELAGVR